LKPAGAFVAVRPGAIACHCTKMRTSSMPSAAHALTAAAALTASGWLSNAASSAIPVSIEVEAWARAGSRRAAASAAAARRTREGIEGGKR
jgi:hypothetical protein